MYRERLLLTQQRLLRSDLFTLHGFSRANKSRLSEGEQVNAHSSLRIVDVQFPQPSHRTLFFSGADLTMYT